MLKSAKCVQSVFFKKLKLRTLDFIDIIFIENVEFDKVGNN
jgi:hypothetical protein